GVGKTHLASALCYHACLNDYKCLFTTAINLINELNASLSDNSFFKLMKRYTQAHLLVIDELGYLPVDKTGADLLFQIISNRYETGSVIITTNRPFKEWDRIFNNDATLASALIDHLAHHGIIIQIKGESYRIKNR
ncbi:MAG TPA: ATP-binding protein, partial [Caldithrix abyssi]|nr:ATP-binding protein [Caldithrix abyssi]